MKASELIQKLLEITAKEGKDFEVVTDYQAGFYDMYHPRNPEYIDIYNVELQPADLENEEFVISI